MVVKNYSEHAQGRRFCAFTVSVAGAHDLAARFTEAGYRVAAIDGAMDKGIRAGILRQLAAGELDGVTNCAVLTEGWDEPSISCILLVRPTGNDGLYLQMVGRGLRPRNGHKPEPGEECLILDFCAKNVRNLTKFGRVLDLPPEERKRLDDAEAALDSLDDQIDAGDEQAGLVFDGQMTFSGLAEKALQCIAVEINYLQASPFVWQRTDGWMLLSLGASPADNHERILAVAPPAPGTGIRTLYGISRRGLSPREREERRFNDNAWGVQVLRADDDHDSLMEYADEVAGRHSMAVLTRKNNGWMDHPATDGQRNKLKYHLRAAGHADPDLTKGRAGELIACAEAKNALHLAGHWDGPAPAQLATNLSRAAQQRAIEVQV